MGIDALALLRPALFLDRDGVLNEALGSGAPRAPSDPSELRVFPGIAEKLFRLRAAGLLLVVVTNQPDVARGSLTLDTLGRIHDRLRKELPCLDEIAVCPHDDADDCGCRKPRPGLLTDAARRLGIDLARSYLVGDRWRDVEAGHAAGCTTLLVEHEWRERKPSVEPDVRTGSPSAAFDWVAADLGRRLGARREGGA